MVGVHVPLNFSAEAQVVLRPVGAAVGGAFFPLFFGWDIGDAAARAEEEFVIAIGEARPGDNAGFANHDGAGAAAVSKVHRGLTFGPSAFEGVVASLCEVGGRVRRS